MRSGPAAGDVTLVLQQTGSKVTGSITVGGRPDISGPITGTVNGNAVAVQAGQRLRQHG